MKKIILLTIAVATLNNYAFSQQDTAYPPIYYSNACFLDITAYSQSGLGYLSGTNTFGDLEKAQKYRSKSKVTITGVLCRLEAGSKVNNSNTYVKIYNVNYTNEQPAFELGKSAAVSMSNIKTIGYTYYTFATPVTINDPFKKGNSDFFASVVLPTGAADALGVFSTKVGCFSGDSLAFECSKDGIWQSMYRGWKQQTPPYSPFSCDLIIIPVVSGTWTPGTVGTMGVQEESFFNGITLQNHPNPVSNSTMVQYELEKAAQEVTLEVFDITGSLVLSVHEGMKTAGKHYIQLSTEKLAKGTYIYTLTADENRLAKQMIIAE